MCLCSLLCMGGLSAPSVALGIYVQPPYLELYVGGRRREALEVLRSPDYGGGCLEWEEEPSASAWSAWNPAWDAGMEQRYGTA